MRWAGNCWIFLSLIILTSSLFCQEKMSAEKMATVACTFQDGKQMSVRYPEGITSHSAKLSMKQVWAPGGAPLVLFTDTNLMVTKTVVPAGAYFLYLVPDKENWTLVVNRNVTAGVPYDQEQDVVRVPMEHGTVSEAQPFSVVLGHVAPQQCNMRIYFAKAGSWAEFQETTN